MRITRVIALTIIGASLGITALDAQTLRNSSPPAEFPPASYKGKQYVDSKGCIYIRAGIDGNVTWVPRVTRSRKQVCGYKPTAVAGATKTPTQQAKPPEQITINQPATTQPAARTTTSTTRTTSTTTTSTAATSTATATTTAPRSTQPVRTTTTRTTTARPTTTTRTTAPAVATTTTTPRVQTSPVTTAPAATTRTTAPARSGGCSNASAFSQQFINNSGVRCGPQQEAPITYGTGRKSSSLESGTQGSTQQAGVPVSLETRIVPLHVYDKRQNTTNFDVPAGYRTVWDDDRLNPKRAERTIRPAIQYSQFAIPAGYRLVEREDDRLNPNRGIRTAEGDAQTALIWTDDLPRTLRPVATNPRTIEVVHGERAFTNTAEAPTVIPSGGSATSGPKYGDPVEYRVAVYSSPNTGR